MGGGWALCSQAEPIWLSNALLASTANMGAPNFKIMSVNSLQACVLHQAGPAQAKRSPAWLLLAQAVPRAQPTGSMSLRWRLLSWNSCIVLPYPVCLSWDTIHELCFCRARLLCPLASKCAREQAQRPLPDSPEPARPPIPIQIPQSSDETLSPG